MAPVARGLSMWMGPNPAFQGWDAAFFVWLFLTTLCTGTESGASGAAERRDGTIEGGWMEFYTAELAEELGQGESRD